MLNKELRTIRRNLFRHVEMLSKQIGERNIKNYSNLHQAYNYILTTMRKSSFQVTDFMYHHEQRDFHNIVASKIGQQYPEEIVIIGAHYDTVNNSPGADDNASGIAAILELIRLLNFYENKRTIRFVAFTLEEPPFYGTAQMGSQVYAQLCKQHNENIIMMVSLEMLAYFTKKKKSQQYPLPEMAKTFPDQGNFIAIIGDVKSGLVVKKLTTLFQQYSSHHVQSLISHQSVPGVNLSDHVSFWKEGYKALMITDTAFYRNPHYHKSNDTIDKLDFKSYAQIVSGLQYTFQQFDVAGIE